MKKIQSFFVIVVFLLGATTTQAQEIFDAVKNNDLAKVKEFIEASPQLMGSRDEYGRTPLHWAARGVHFEVLKYLVEKGADVNTKDNNGVAPLHSLITRAHIDGTAFLLTKKADINDQTNSGDTPLHSAVQSGDINIVRLLLDKGAEHSIRNNSGDTPLNIAVVIRNEEIVETLLEKRAEYDGSGIKALNMLQISARNGFEKMFKIIIEKEGNKLFTDKEKNRWTMQDAVTGGSVDLVKILENKNIPIEKKGDIYGWTLLHYAVSKGKLPMIEYLVLRGIDIDKRTKGGETAYNIAEIEGHKEAQILLARLGARKEPVKFPVLRGKYLGQKPPGMKPEIFAPGIVSRPDLKELMITFSPDGQEVFFYRVLAGNYSKIYNSRIANGRWSAPEEFSITSAYSAFIPLITLDNKRMFFNWSNPQIADPFQIWVTERIDEDWSKPIYAGRGFFLSQSMNGEFYISDFSSFNYDRKIYLAKVSIDNNQLSNYERIIFPDQTGSRAHPCIAPDGSYLIFDEGEGDHIQISFKKKDGTWGKALDLTHYGFEPLAGIPSMSRDGKYLFFKLGCRGQYDIGHGDTNRDIWWVDIKVIENLRPKESDHL